MATQMSVIMMTRWLVTDKVLTYMGSMRVEECVRTAAIIQRGLTVTAADLVTLDPKACHLILLMFANVSCTTVA